MKKLFKALFVLLALMLTTTVSSATENWLTAFPTSSSTTASGCQGLE